MLASLFIPIGIVTVVLIVINSLPILLGLKVQQNHLFPLLLLAVTQIGLNTLPGGGTTLSIYPIVWPAIVEVGVLTGRSMSGQHYAVSSERRDWRRFGPG